MNDGPVYIPTGRCSEIKCSFNYKVVQDGLDKEGL